MAESNTTIIDRFAANLAKSTENRTAEGSMLRVALHNLAAEQAAARNKPSVFKADVYNTAEEKLTSLYNKNNTDEAEYKTLLTDFLVGLGQMDAPAEKTEEPTEEKPATRTRAAAKETKTDGGSN